MCVFVCVSEIECAAEYDLYLYATVETRPNLDTVGTEESVLISEVS